MTRVGEGDLSLRIFTIERVTDANDKEKTTNLVLEGIARLYVEWRTEGLGTSRRGKNQILEDAIAGSINFLEDGQHMR